VMLPEQQGPGTGAGHETRPDAAATDSEPSPPPVARPGPDESIADRRSSGWRERRREQRAASAAERELRKREKQLARQMNDDLRTLARGRAPEPKNVAAEIEGAVEAARTALAAEAERGQHELATAAERAVKAVDERLGERVDGLLAEVERTHREASAELRAEVDRLVEEHLAARVEERLTALGQRLDALVDLHLGKAEERVHLLAEDRVREARLLLVGQVEDEIKELTQRIDAARGTALEGLRHLRDEADARLESSAETQLARLDTAFAQHLDRLQEGLRSSAIARVREEAERAGERAESSLGATAERILEERIEPRLRETEQRLAAAASSRLEDAARHLAEQFEGRLRETIDSIRTAAEQQLKAYAEGLVRESGSGSQTEPPDAEGSRVQLHQRRGRFQDQGPDVDLPAGGGDQQRHGDAHGGEGGAEQVTPLVPAAGDRPGGQRQE
jgi:hypothetical protein